MIVLTYSPDGSGLTLPDNKIIPYAADNVALYADSEDVYSERVSSVDICYAYAHAMKKQEKTPTDLVIWLAGTEQSLTIDADYNFNGVYFFSDHMTKILMDMF